MTTKEASRNGLGRPKDDELNPQEELFVEAYIVNFDELEAFNAAKYSAPSPKKYALQILDRPRVQKAISERVHQVVEDMGINESQVVAGLLREANNVSKGSTQTARINAWVWLGKHIGMFAEAKASGKEVSSGPTYNIINYSNSNSTIKPPSEVIKEVSDTIKVTKKQTRDIEAKLTNEDK